MQLSIGTANFGLKYGQDNEFRQLSRDDIIMILNLAQDNKINHLDTAGAYGDSEKILGKIGVERWKVTGKIPSIPKDEKNVQRFIESKINESLNNLKIPFFESILIHNPNDFVTHNANQIVNGLRQIKTKGFVKKIGVSVYQKSELDHCLNYFEPDVVQFPLNLLDNRFIEDNYLTTGNRQGIEVHIRSIFLQGILAAPLNVQPSVLKKWPLIWSYWGNWLKRNNICPVEASTRFAMNLDRINKVVVGVNNIKQLKQIIKFSKKPPLPMHPNWPNKLDTNLLDPRMWNK